MNPSLRFRTLCCLAFSVACVGAAYTQGDKKNSNAAPTPQEFFGKLAQHSNSDSMPSYEDVLKVVDQIPAQTSTEARMAVPSIVLALSNPNDEIKKDAGLALTVVARRPDGPELLRGQASRIEALLNEPNDRLQAGGVFIFGLLAPKDASEVLPILIAFVRREDRAPQAQASAIGILARNAPEEKEARAAIKAFFLRPLDSDTRINALNSLRNSRLEDYQIADVVIRALDDSDEGVRFTAVQVIPTMGPHVLSQAEPALRTTLERRNESNETKELARKALEQISLQKK